MSQRTSEANKAIAAAWANEQQLVREGKGTRDWTPEQQQDILDRGKAYDDNGKAFEGHHMKSVDSFPEHQGDSANIEFLSRAEHFAAHSGNYQNPTNGYFNPQTGETKDFGTNTYEPCKIIDLSEPLQCENTKITPVASDISSLNIASVNGGGANAPNEAENTLGGNGSTDASDCASTIPKVNPDASTAATSDPVSASVSKGISI